VTARSPWRRPGAGSGAVAALLALLALATTADAQSPPQWAITGVNLVDGTGRPTVAGATITGSGERITCAGPSATCPVPPEATVLSAAGKWVIPGLIDTHVHLHWEDPAATRRAQLVRFAFGVTTAREAGTSDSLEQSLQYRAQTNLVTSPEPRLLVSGLLSEQHRLRYGAPSPEALVGKLAAMGVDAIKVKPQGDQFTSDGWRAIVDAAHAAHLPVWGHTWNATASELRDAVEAGIDGVTHATTFLLADHVEAAANAPRSIEDWMRSKDEWGLVDDSRVKAMAKMLVAKGIWFEPTLVTEKNFTLPYPFARDIHYLGSVPTLWEQFRPLIPVGDSSLIAVRDRRRRMASNFQHICRLAQAFHEAGGVMTAGTDEETPGRALADEIELLHDCGLSTVEALQAASSVAARVLRLPDRGSIGPGMIADLVILNAEPTGSAEALRHVWRVVKGGRVYDPAVLLAPLVQAYEHEWRRTWAIRAGLAAAVAIAMFGVWAVVRARSRRMASGTGR
jgi:imidazolonepropionase-like amidohydrolase